MLSVLLSEGNLMSHVADIHAQPPEGQSRTHWLIVVAEVLGRTYK